MVYKIENINRIIEILPDDATEFTHTIGDLESNIEFCKQLNIVDKNYPVLPVIRYFRAFSAIFKIEFSNSTKLSIILKK